MVQSKRSLARLVAALLHAQERERTRIVRLLHDEVGQALSAAGLQLDVARMDLAGQAPQIAGRIERSQKLLEEAVERVRRLSQKLNVGMAERAGLGFALERLAEQARGRFAGELRVELEPAIPLPGEAAGGLYRIAECALENALIHSGGDRITLCARSAKNSVVLEIADNGKGFALPEARKNPSGVGLLLMEHVARQLGIRLHFKSGPGKGTIVRAKYTDRESGVGRRHENC